MSFFAGGPPELFHKEFVTGKIFVSDPYSRPIPDVGLEALVRCAVHAKNCVVFINHRSQALAQE